MRTLVILFCMAICATAFAQAPGQTPPLQPQAPQQAKAEKIKQRIRALRAYTLTDRLALDEQTAGKLFPILAKYDDEFDRLLREHADLQRQLNAAASSNDPKATDKLIDDAIANQRALRDREDRRIVELRKILTPAQVARLLVVLPAFERKIQNQLRNAIQKAKKRADADTDDDDDDEPDARPPPPRKLPPPPARSTNTHCNPFDSVNGCR